MSENFTLALADETATLAFGAKLADVLTPGINIYLHGDLGAGKTTLVRGILRALGHEGKVKSPTYTLVESYSVSKLEFYHFDFYRFIDHEEWEATGFRDYFNQESLSLVEWPEKAQELLPAPDIDICLQPEGHGRRVMISTSTDSGKQCLTKLDLIS